MMKNELLKELFDISLDAGKKIMAVYKDEIVVEIKEDSSPLTIADQLSHVTILEGLQKVDASIPVLSEEGASLSYDERKNWSAFWLVDPLDGTKEFIKKNDEFTVNIAYIENGYPTLGVIYVPALDQFYIGCETTGAYKLEHASQHSITSTEQLLQLSTKIQVSSVKGNSVSVIASRSHLSTETEAYIAELENSYKTVNVKSAGSSLKFCLVAEGLAHFYPRFAPTMEWDTGAGQAIVEAAGGDVLDYRTNTRKRYNQKSLRNDWFLVKGENEQPQ